MLGISGLLTESSDRFFALCHLRENWRSFELLPRAQIPRSPSSVRLLGFQAGSKSGAANGFICLSRRFLDYLRMVTTDSTDSTKYIRTILVNPSCIDSSSPICHSRSPWGALWSRPRPGSNVGPAPNSSRVRGGIFSVCVPLAGLVVLSRACSFRRGAGWMGGAGIEGFAS